MADAKKIDPFDVEALEKSLNDSATRVSTIWVSFLLFGLYFPIAVGNVTHRQLFLEDPIKLPFLNIDLPLIGFFVLAPFLFVSFHIYVIVQVMLLARTAAAYNDALMHLELVASAEARIRQRLANTLFAQVFAGSPRERYGIFGRLLKTIAWTTLAICPILVLLVFELKFLPYHHHVATWCHRILLAADVGAVLLLWPSVLDAGRDISGRNVIQQKILFILMLVLVVFSWLAITFPGELHSKFTRPSSATPQSIDCETRSVLGSILDSNFDRLYLPREDVVDDEKLARIEAATKTRGLSSYEGERTRNFRGRNFDCGIFDGADLRRIDLADAKMRGASLNSADLESSNLERAKLQRADFSTARMFGSNLSSAQLQGSSLRGARLRGANLFNASLQGADLSSAWLQLAYFNEAHLEGVDLFEAQAQAAFFFNAHLEGARLTLTGMQGTQLFHANFTGAGLFQAQFAGASFSDADLTLTSFAEPFLWRAGSPKCHNTRVAEPRFEPIVSYVINEAGGDTIVEAKPAQIESFMKEAFSHVPDDAGQLVWFRRSITGDSKESVQAERDWRTCATNSKVMAQDEFNSKRALFLRDLACTSQPLGDEAEQIALTDGLIRNWIGSTDFGENSYRSPDDRYLAIQLARGLVERDGRSCFANKFLSEKTKSYLRTLSGD